MYFPQGYLLTSAWKQQQNKMSYLEYTINIHHLIKQWWYIDLMLTKKKAFGRKT